jgi:hypothetical protein
MAQKQKGHHRRWQVMALKIAMGSLVCGQVTCMPRRSSRWISTPMVADGA